MISIGFEEVFPLWALSTPSAGGLGWGTHQIGQASFLDTVGAPCRSSSVSQRICEAVPQMQYKSYYSTPRYVVGSIPCVAHRVTTEGWNASALVSFFVIFVASLAATSHSLQVQGGIFRVACTTTMCTFYFRFSALGRFKLQRIRSRAPQLYVSVAHAS